MLQYNHVNTQTYSLTHTTLHILFKYRIKDKTLKQKTNKYYNQIYHLQSIYNRHDYYQQHAHTLTSLHILLRNRIKEQTMKGKKTETGKKQILESVISFTIHI